MVAAVSTAVVRARAVPGLAAAAAKAQERPAAEAKAVVATARTR